MDPLEPMEQLERDYYLGENSGWYSGGENPDTDSSDDEIQKQMAKIAGVTKFRVQRDRIESPTFETDMNHELDETLSAHASAIFCHVQLEGEYKPKSVEASEEHKMDAACSSSTDNNTDKCKKSQKRSVRWEDKTNENGEEKVNKCEGKTSLDFYDPNEDDDNELWVAAHRKDRSLQDCHEQVAEMDGGAMPNSDAVLSCPGCMTLLCRDCQRHDLYKTQYRAMFVENCRIGDTETLYVPLTGASLKKSRKNKKVADGAGTNDASDLFRPVSCSVCNTQVAVLDRHEVYHFFHVLSGYS